MTDSIKVPTWTIPLIVSLVVGATSYGAAQADAEATAEEVSRIEKIVIQTAERTSENGKNTALNAQAIRNISESLARQQQTAQASDEKLAQLIEIMLRQK